jgi:hypothetical protein
MAKAAKKVIVPSPAAQRQQYADPEGRRPPYFGEREPVVSSLEAIVRGEGNLRADASRAHTILLDGPPPLTGDEWLKAEALKMKQRPDCPYEITEAARQLKLAMHEAFIRRQCDAQWGAGGITNKLRDWKLWPPRRRSRRHPR